MRKFLSEVVGCVALALLGMPAVGDAQPVGSQDPSEPVVFVYGYDGNTSHWAAVEAVFRDAGYAAEQLHAFDYDWTRSNEHSAAELAAFVDTVLQRTGAPKVDVVSHSMGALVSGWYAKKLGGADKIDDWVSLAGANHGTTTALTCVIHPSCREMLPGSDFVRRLHSGGEAPAPVRWSTWYSPEDGVIIPYGSAALAGADNHEVPFVRHLGFLADTEILAEVARTTSADRHADFSRGGSAPNGGVTWNT